MPLLKINGMTLKVLPDVATPKMPLTDALRAILPPAAAEYQERWQLEFFGCNYTPQMPDGEIDVDLANKTITGNPRTLMKYHERELRDGLSHHYREPQSFDDLWLGKRQFPYFDEIWGYSDEVQKLENKCSCGRCHITYPSPKVKRTRKQQEPEIQAYELVA